jgi:hypothetical protein
MFFLAKWLTKYQFKVTRLALTCFNNQELILIKNKCLKLFTQMVFLKQQLLKKVSFNRREQAFVVFEGS